ncbi:winged helix-turn-helix transcriptional regulator [Candidatus Woesebacteria bacterium]|nr:winged helix-turn-helix transcriptional regulator [Candidatus Woesebacteria bacterium]
MNNLQDFMISKVRVKMMELFFTHIEEMYYVREITREIKEEINAVRRELDRMLASGILKSEQRGNRLYYSLNNKYPYFQEIHQMVVKSTGLGKKLRKLRRKLGSVSFVMFSGRFVRGLVPRQGEIDMLVIGEVVLPELEQIVKAEEQTFGREINYAIFSDDEFEFRKTRRDPFVMDVLYGSRIMVVGNEDDFVERNLPGI